MEFFSDWKICPPRFFWNFTPGDFEPDFGYWGTDGGRMGDGCKSEFYSCFAEWGTDGTDNYPLFSGSDTRAEGSVCGSTWGSRCNSLAYAREPVRNGLSSVPSVPQVRFTPRKQDQKWGTDDFSHLAEIFEFQVFRKMIFWPKIFGIPPSERQRILNTGPAGNPLV